MPTDPLEKSSDESVIARRRDELLAAAREAASGTPARNGPGAQMMGLGVQFVASILLCLYAGRWLDQRLGTGPWLLLAGVAVGASAGFYAMYRALVAEDRRLDEEKRR